MKKQFENLLKNRHWKLELKDSCTNDWNEHWVIDGKEAKISHNSEGMTFAAGPNQNDASHAVLWTKQRFKGDMRVKFIMTRLDDINRFVNIMYFQANGIGTIGAPKDIHLWREERLTPSMSTYFTKMDLLHISFAAFGNDNDEADDYIRVRRYPVTPERSFDEIEVEPTIFNTNLFESNAENEIEVIKTSKDLAMIVTGKDKELFQHWDISKVSPLEEGPFGFRHMHKKVTRYKNIEIYTS